MRLIDADALILDFCDNPSYSATMFSKIRNRINNAPTIDAVPVVHGRWVEYLDFWRKCSECGASWHEQWIFGKHMHYCSNCGAKMDGE